MCFQRPARKGGVGKAGLKNGRLTSEWRTADVRFKRNYAADSPQPGAGSAEHVLGAATPSCVCTANKSGKRKSKARECAQPAASACSQPCNSPSYRRDAIDMVGCWRAHRARARESHLDRSLDAWPSGCRRPRRRSVRICALARSLQP